MLPTRCGQYISDEPLAEAASGWILSAEVANGGAECLVVDGSDGDAIAATAHWSLPLVAVVRDDTPLPLLDRCDGFVLPGDDATAFGRVLDRATVRQPVLAVGDFADSTAAAIGALSADASRIAEALQSLASRPPPGEPQPVTAATVRGIIKLRRDRERFMPAMLFADPAWDMMLDLAAARLERRDVPISSLCIAAAVPTTTALRWIRTLIEAGMFERYSDPGDARRSHVRLTEAAAEAMLGWLRLFTSQLAAR